MEVVIKAQGLSRYFGSIKAVDDISFAVERGELFGFLGVNGAGKSTTINMLCTILKPTAGNVEICGLELGKKDMEIRKKIGVVYQNNCLDDKLTVKENLFTRGALYEKNRGLLAENIARMVEILELSDVYKRSFGKLSGGQKRRCEIARALIHTPDILFLDEPTTGLDPATRKKVWECLEKLRREDNMTVFLTTHYMEEAARASHIAVMDTGKVKEYGTPFSLKEVYAKDKLRLVPRNGKTLELEETLRKMEMSVRKKEEYLTVSLPDSLAALPVLSAVEALLEGFEMVQGSMDDVFLNITGKTAEGI